MFSIIVPLYNKEHFVSKALNSVLNQSFKDWELIVVNDGSTDKSYDVASKLIVGDRRCRIINQKNAGVGAARNHGVAESKGDFLCFLDADDWWEMSYLEEMAGFVVEYPDAGIYSSNYIYLKKGKTQVVVNHPTGYINYPKSYLENGKMPICIGTVCMPRQLFDKYGGFPSNIKLGEDFLLWSKIALENRIAFLNKPLFYYNNEIPPSQRATRNLYAPENHMLFNLDWLDKRVPSMDNNQYWRDLIDMLRVNGLMEYWLSKDYHNRAAEELKKVDWSRQPKSIIRKYQMPIWYLLMMGKVMLFGSKVKQMFV